MKQNLIAKLAAMVMAIALLAGLAACGSKEAPTLSGYCFSLLMTNLLIQCSGQVNIFLNVTAPTLPMEGGSIVYDSRYGLDEAGLTAMLAASDLHDAQTMAEGAVLLKHDGAVLPLTGSERRVTLFGRAAADPVYRGNSGGPSSDARRQVSLRGALEAAGFAVNETLFDAYAASSLSSPAARNFGGFTYSNSNSHYVIQAEGIYVGYKYYETRYHDQVLGLHNANSEAGEASGGLLTDAQGNVVPGNAAVVTLAEADDTTYAVSPETGAVVSNLFDDIDYNHFVSRAVTYLTRSDWNTYPQSCTGMTLTAGGGIRPQ